MKIKRIAHRGFSSEAPENTRASFALAVEGDFYGVECDIWKSKDGVYVVSHDGHLRRMCEVDREIPDMNYDEIIQYPLKRGHKYLEHPVQHLICFTEYLSIVSRNDKIHPVIELKLDYTTVELGEIVELVRHAGLLERTFFISLHQSVLIRLKEEFHFPTERLQYVYGAVEENREVMVDANLEQWLCDNRLNLDSRFTLVTPELVERLHAAGLVVNVWTVNSFADTKRMLIECKVDMITTEYYHEI